MLWLHIGWLIGIFIMILVAGTGNLDTFLSLVTGVNVASKLLHLSTGNKTRVTFHDTGWSIDPYFSLLVK